MKERERRERENKEKKRQRGKREVFRGDVSTRARSSSCVGSF
jgi:hypothetical protein